MAEQHATDAEGRALSGATLTRAGVPVPTTDETDWHGPLNAALDHIDRISASSVGCRVFAETGLTTFGVRAGEFIDPRTGAVVTYAGASAQSLTASQTNYIYLDPDGTLAKSTSAFPSTVHVPLAEIVAGAGSAYTLDDLTDRRVRAMLTAVDANPGRRFRIREDFSAAAGATLPTPWSSDTLATATADYVDDSAAGVYRLGLTAADAAEAAQLTWGDQLMIDADNDPVAEFRVRIDGLGDMTSVERVAVGLASAHAAAEDSLDAVATNCWFLIVGGSTNIYMESDDGTTDTDDTDTGIDLVDDTWTIFRIDMSDLAAVRMFVDGVEAGSTLDMTDAAGEVLQPIVAIQRDDATQTEAAVRVEIDLAAVAADR